MRLRKRRPAPDDEGFYAVMPADQVPPDAPVAARAGETPIVLVRLAGDVVAVGRRCPHAAGDFARGRLAGGRLTCPEHDYTFDLASGRILWPPDEVYRLRRFPTRVVAGVVYVKPV